jgi:hypothetical protein
MRRCLRLCDRMLKKGFQLCSRLEEILNVPQRVRLRYFSRLRPRWAAFLSILRIHPQRSVGYGTIQYFY